LRQIIFIIILLAASFAFSINYQAEIDFFEYYLINYTPVNEKTTLAMSERLEYLYNNDILHYNKVTPIELIAYMYVETTYRNVTGDNKQSLGYFQIQKDAYYYVRSYFENDLLVPKINWDWENVRPMIKTQITVAGLYLQLIRENYGLHSWLAISRYNGHNDSSIYYASKVTNKLSELLSIFYEWQVN
jgi:hypothetical protein